MNRRLSFSVVIGAVALGFYLRWAAADHLCMTQWDEAYHALVAKNLSRHPLTPTLYERPYFDDADRGWRGGHIWLHKPPVPLWLMAAAIAVAGDSEPVFRFPSVALGALSILLTFLIALELWGERGRPAGAAAAILQALNPFLIRLASGTIPTDHVDGALTFFVELTVYLFLLAARKRGKLWPILAGISLGLGFLSKAWPCFTAVAAVLPFARKNWGWAIVAAVLTALPWQLYTAWMWPDVFMREWSYNTGQHLLTALDGHAHPIWWYFSLIPVQYGGFKLVTCLLAGAALAWALYDAVATRKSGIICVLIWALLPYIAFSLSMTKLYSYVAPAAPAVLLLFCYPLAAAKRGRMMLAPAALLALYALTLFSQRVAADYGSCPGNFVYDPAEFRSAMLQLRATPGPKAVFNVRDDKDIQAMYYCECSAYPGMPTPEQSRELRAQGVKIYILGETIRLHKTPPPFDWQPYEK